MRRQGTEPSRRFLVDLNTGLLKEHLSEMDRRVGGFYNAASNPGFRQGTQNSQATLVDLQTGLQLPKVSEMQRQANVDRFRQGTENSKATLVELRRAQIMRDLKRTEASKDETTHKAVAPELRRQGTEPSRRFLVDLNTGLLKEHLSEMDRRVGGFYNPAANPGFRQGTQNSQATLVDLQTGLQLPKVSEMQRQANVDRFRQGTENSKATLVELRRAQIMRDLKRTEASKDETTHKAVAPELRRQGTEPSRRFLVDLNTGLLKEHLSEMDRRVGGFYNPAANPGFRQGTQNSQATLVDLQTGLQLPKVSEMQRQANVDRFRQGTENSKATLVELRKDQIMMDLKSIEAVKDELTHKADHNTFTLKDSANDELPEFGRSLEYRHAQHRDAAETQETNEVDISLPGEEYRRGLEYRYANIIDKHFEAPAKQSTRISSCHGQVIEGKCYVFNPKLLSFSEAEASCKQFSSLGHLASVPSSEIHKRLVGLVTGSASDLVLTWVGGFVKDHQFQWTDASGWGYSDWMPGHPNIQEHKELCVEMFKMDESWWTAVDCSLKRASICSYPMKA
ncbi:uncharacterized protein wu:fa56d06 isoform X2 [Trichomycterus rosablanca]|uniref:uncharacterized protein wu:fa56d06 isoform X2 n=1 Tax=Trichomycterus rosablanca TaxID=2290929 RepID=UPI002F353E5F